MCIYIYICTYIYVYICRETERYTYTPSKGLPQPAKAPSRRRARVRTTVVIDSRWSLCAYSCYCWLYVIVSLLCYVCYSCMFSKLVSERPVGKASLYVPDLSKLKTRRYMYRTCTQTWLTWPLWFKSYNCSFGTWWFFFSKGVRSVPVKLAWIG